MCPTRFEQKEDGDGSIKKKRLWKLWPWNSRVAALPGFHNLFL